MWINLSASFTVHYLTSDHHSTKLFQIRTHGTDDFSIVIQIRWQFRVIVILLLHLRHRHKFGAYHGSITVVPSAKYYNTPTLFCFDVVHDDVIKWKHFPRYWPFVWGIHRSPVNSPHKGQWRGALMFTLICAWINGWVNNREAGDLRRYCAH